MEAHPADILKSHLVPDDMRLVSAWSTCSLPGLTHLDSPTVLYYMRSISRGINNNVKQHGDCRTARVDSSEIPSDNY